MLSKTLNTSIDSFTLSALVALTLVVWMCVSSLANAAEINQGDKGFVPCCTWMVVTVENYDTVSDSNLLESREFNYGDMCGVPWGGDVEADKIVGNRVLVRYSTNRFWQYGSPCPDGVLFFTTKKIFSDMVGEYERVQRELKKNWWKN